MKQTKDNKGGDAPPLAKTKSKKHSISLGRLGGVFHLDDLMTQSSMDPAERHIPLLAAWLRARERLANAMKAHMAWRFHGRAGGSYREDSQVHRGIALFCASSTCMFGPNIPVMPHGMGNE